MQKLRTSYSLPKIAKSLKTLLNAYVLFVIITSLVQPISALFYNLEANFTLLQYLGFFSVSLLICAGFGYYLLPKIESRLHLRLFSFTTLYCLLIVLLAWRTIEILVLIGLLICLLPLSAYLWNLAKTEVNADFNCNDLKRGLKLAKYFNLGAYLAIIVRTFWLFFVEQIYSLPAIKQALGLGGAANLTDPANLDATINLQSNALLRAPLSLANNRFAFVLEQRQLQLLYMLGWSLVIAIIVGLIFYLWKLSQKQRLALLVTPNTKLDLQLNTAASQGGKLKKLQRTYLISAICILIAIQIGAACSYQIIRVLNLSCPTYDMGIFSQMFHYMRETGAAMTTVERDGYLSHFAVHLSPIFYLWLPIYYLIPSPLTLQVLQVLTVALGLIPLLALCRHFQLSLPKSGCLALLYAFAPGLVAGNFYDVHENCFLAPLLLWVIYARYSKNYWQLGLATLLTLLVKEDAFVYLVCLGIYFLLSLVGEAPGWRQSLQPGSGPNLQLGLQPGSEPAWCQSLQQVPKQAWQPDSTAKAALTNAAIKRQEFVKLGLLLIVVPLVYFQVALYYLSTYGEGAMLYRFDALLLPDQSGLSQMLLNCLCQPISILTSMFAAPKLLYFGIVLLCLGFYPLRQVKWWNYSLLLPLLLINLLSSWKYQYDISFQYNYGSSALLIFMTVLALKENSLNQEKLAVAPTLKQPVAEFASNHGLNHAPKNLNLEKVSLLMTVIMAVYLTLNLLSPQLNKWRDYHNYSEYYEQQRSVLAKLPRDQRLLADTFYTTSLSDVKELYDVNYHLSGSVDPNIDYVVVPQTSSKDELILAYQKAGYVKSDLSNDKILVLVAPKTP